MWASDEAELAVEPRRVLRLLLAIVGAMALLGVTAEIVKHSPSLHGAFPGDKVLQQQFILDAENNIPTWFSSALLLSSAVLAALLAFIESGSRSTRRHWKGLAVIFFVLSIDETASLHETVNSTLRERFDLGGILYFAWVIPGVVAVALVGLAYLGFVWRLPLQVRWKVVVAGATYLSGVVGMELVGGAWADSRGKENLGYGLITTTEELLEMLGLSLFIYALLVLLKRLGPLTLRRQSMSVAGK